jgi:hypothetical protein
MEWPKMLYQFLNAHESDLVERCRVKASKRPMPKETKDALHHGIPVFLQQLVRSLQTEQMSDPLHDRRVSGPAGGGRRAPSKMSKAAAIHGRKLLDHGFTIDQVVHAYGDVCQSVKDLAFELRVPFEIEEFRSLNRCVDGAIDYALMDFSYQRETMNARVIFWGLVSTSIIVSIAMLRGMLR